LPRAPPQEQQPLPQSRRIQNEIQEHMKGQKDRVFKQYHDKLQKQSGWFEKKNSKYLRGIQNFIHSGNTQQNFKSDITKLKNKEQPQFLQILQNDIKWTTNTKKLDILSKYYNQVKKIVQAQTSLKRLHDMAMRCRIYRTLGEVPFNQLRALFAVDDTVRSYIRTYPDPQLRTYLEALIAEPPANVQEQKMRHIQALKGSPSYDDNYVDYLNDIQEKMIDLAKRVRLLRLKYNVPYPTIRKLYSSSFESLELEPFPSGVLDKKLESYYTKAKQASATGAQDGSKKIQDFEKENKELQDLIQILKKVRRQDIHKLKYGRRWAQQQGPAQFSGVSDPILKQQLLDEEFKKSIQTRLANKNIKNTTTYTTLQKQRRLKQIEKKKDSLNEQTFKNFWKNLAIVYRFYHRAGRSLQQSQYYRPTSISDDGTVVKWKESIGKGDFTYEVMVKNCEVTFDPPFPIIRDNLLFYDSWKPDYQIFATGLKQYNQRLKTFFQTPNEKTAPYSESGWNFFGFSSRKVHPAPSDKIPQERFQPQTNIGVRQGCLPIYTSEQYQISKIIHGKLSKTTGVFLTGIKLWWLLRHLNFMPDSYMKNFSFLQYDPTSIMGFRKKETEKGWIFFSLNDSEKWKIKMHHVDIWNDNNKYFISTNNGSTYQLKTSEQFQTRVIETYLVWKDRIQDIPNSFVDYLTFIKTFYAKLIDIREQRKSWFHWLTGNHTFSFTMKPEFQKALDTVQEKILTQVKTLSEQDMCTLLNKLETDIKSAFSSLMKGVNIQEQEYDRFANILFHLLRTYAPDMDKLESEASAGMRILSERHAPKMKEQRSKGLL